MSNPASAEKHSVTIPAATSEGVRARVGKRGFSSYIAGAVARQLERDALDDIIERMRAKNGPVEEDAIAAIMARLSE